MPEAIILRGDMTRKAVWKVIPAFAFPLLLGNLLQQAYHLTDSIIVGRLLGKEALAAVSASFFLYYFIISLVIGVGSGMTVVVSQCYGAGRYRQVQRAFSSFFLFMFVAGVLLSAIGILLAGTFFRWTQTPAEVIPQAVRYFRIYIGGTFLFVTFNSILSILRGIGDSMRPMCFILAAVVVNVALDLLFIVVFRWGVEGAAWATVVAQAAGAGIALYHVNRRHPLLSIRRRDLVFDRKLFARGLKIGLPTGVQQCSIALGLIALLGVVNRLGTDALTAYGAAGKIEALITQAVLTLSGALASFCGQNIGARRFDRVRKGVRFVMAVNLLFGLLSFAAVYFRGKEMMQAFTADEAVIAIGHEYLLIIGGFFAVHGALNVLNGALRGAGDTLFGMLTGIVSFWLARIPLAYFLGGLWGGRGIWWAVNISVAIGLVATCIYYQAGKWRTSRNGELPRMEN